jgi:polar amino acid transport system substrate-binding protein/glutamate/aspartate transport system substrate-binding protein
VVLFKSSAEGLSALKREEIDSYSADQVVLIGLALSSEDPEQFAILPNLFSYEPFALALRRNDADFRLFADRAISGLYGSKEILKIYDKWIGVFSPSRPTAFEALVTLSAMPE